MEESAIYACRPAILRNIIIVQSLVSNHKAVAIVGATMSCMAYLKAELG